LPHSRSAQAVDDVVGYGPGGCQHRAQHLSARIKLTAADGHLVASVAHAPEPVDTLSVTALDNLALVGVGRLKPAFRHRSYAITFVMIAGSFTSIAISGLPPRLAVPPYGGS
jgi:hypothetical protein